MEEQEQGSNNYKMNMIYMTIIEVEDRLFTNQTRHIPTTSNRENKYIVMFYVIVAKHIKSYPIKSCHQSKILRVYLDVCQFLCVCGYWLQIYKLDNETLKDDELFITDNNARLQYRPSSMHRTNPAVRVIRILKNHILSIQAVTPKTHQLSNWCKDLEQTDITLNMMGPCTQTPNLLEHEAMEGMFSFDAKTMAPIGTQCMIHVKPGCWQRGYHAMKAWHFAPALNHYQSFMQWKMLEQCEWQTH